MHTERSEELKTGPDPKKWASDRRSWVGSWSTDQTWSRTPAKATLRIVDSLDGLRNLLPVELYEVVDAITEEPPVEDLDIWTARFAATDQRRPLSFPNSQGPPSSRRSATDPPVAAWPRARPKACRETAPVALGADRRATPHVPILMAERSADAELPIRPGDHRDRAAQIVW